MFSNYSCIVMSYYWQTLLKSLLPMKDKTNRLGFVKRKLNQVFKNFH